jgi:[CysO sulfur-carrier protein]-S-L-cysteine hydrolase
MSEVRDCVVVSRAVVEELLTEARREPELECCGLLAGRDGVISTVLRARNALRSATAYEIAPAELFSLFRRMRAEGLDHMAIYHSHPRGDNAPSLRDVEQAFYPAAAYFILSPRHDAARPVRAFRIVAGESRELVVTLA